MDKKYKSSGHKDVWGFSLTLKTYEKKIVKNIILNIKKDIEEIEVKYNLIIFIDIKGFFFHFKIKFYKIIYNN